MKETSTTSKLFMAHWEKLLDNHPHKFMTFGWDNLFPDLKPEKSTDLADINLVMDKKDIDTGLFVHRLFKTELKSKKKRKEVYLYFRIQFSHEPELPMRMFHYFGRLFTYHDLSICTAVLHLEGNLPKGHNIYKRPNIKFEYSSIDAEEFTLKELRAADNPFSLAVLASRYLKKAGNDLEKRQKYKQECLKLVKEGDYNDFQRESLQEFVEAVF